MFFQTHLTNQIRQHGIQFLMARAHGFPLQFKDGHHQDVFINAIIKGRIPLETFIAKSAFAVQLNCTWIKGKDFQLQPVQIQILKAEVPDGFRDPASQPFAALSGLKQTNSKMGRAQLRIIVRQDCFTDDCILIPDQKMISVLGFNAVKEEFPLPLNYK